MVERCPLCGRELDATADKHHLIPSTFGGRETVRLHQICHNMIHRTFTERELTKHYHTIERLLENEEIKKFVKWVSGKPIDFFVKSKDTKERKRKRRR